MGLGRNQLVISRDTDKSFKMLSALPINLDEVIQQNKATVVYADTVNVRSRVATKGHPLIIVCRVLSFESNSAIDTSGGKGSGFEPGIRQEAAHMPGAWGIDGRPGGSGQSAGDVTILAARVIGVPVIIARGGKGGRPEDGGHGIKGATGTAGQFVERSRDDRTGIDGSQGYQGGAAGLPGVRAMGGKGGNVTLKLMCEPVTWLPDVAAGEPSDFANPGLPGEGGDGGPPGQLKVLEPWCEPYFVNPLAELEQYYELADQLAAGEILSHEDAAIASLIQTERALHALNPRYVHVNFDLQEWFAPKDNDTNKTPRPRQCAPSTRVREVIPGRVGIVGPIGDARAAEVSVRQSSPGEQISGIQCQEVITNEQFSLNADEVWLELMMLLIENDYRRAGNAQATDLVERVTFLLNIANAGERPSSFRQEVYARAFAMNRKINLGLDFYGYTQEQVPLLSFYAYGELLREHILPQAKIIEDTFNRYWDEGQVPEQQRSALRSSMNEAVARKNHVLAYYEDSKTRAHRHLKELTVLDSRVDTTMHTLLAARDKLDAVIQSKNKECDLVGSLMAVGTIVAGVATGGAALIGAAGAGAKLWNDMSATDGTLKSLWNSKSVLEEDLKTIGKEAKTVNESIKSIQGAVSKLNPEQMSLPQFRMEREQFDRVAEEYAEMPEASEYKEAGYDYLAAVEARNQAIVDYNGMLVQLIDIRAQLEAADRIVDGIQSGLNAKSDPAEPYLICMMSRLYRDTLSLAAQLVHAERKALNYYMVEIKDAPISAINVADLMGAVLQNKSKWASWKEQSQHKRPLKPGLFKIDLQKLVAKDTWVMFKKTGILTFTIRHNHEFYGTIFDNSPGLRITGCQLSLIGAKAAPGQQYLPVELTHMGSERIYRADGTSKTFTHKSMLFRGFPSVTGQGDLLESDFSEGGLFAGISPFAAWTLVVKNNPNLQVNLKDLESAWLELNGWMIDG
ncbi:hypothetical protein [Rheinheimera texasensis]|uniref:hypothetical protein n=1 Tax=Rheinheimera texasensis TaxID=306205 RepID=UPI0004E0B940|nr:hypothetical protein [Rheinheimera texasensis]